MFACAACDAGCTMRLVLSSFAAIQEVHYVRMDDFRWGDDAGNALRIAMNSGIDVARRKHQFALARLEFFLILQSSDKWHDYQTGFHLSSRLLDPRQNELPMKGSMRPKKMTPSHRNIPAPATTL